MALIKSGNRNNAEDRKRIRDIRNHSNMIHDLSMELEPDDDDNTQVQDWFRSGSEDVIISYGDEIKSLPGGKLAGYLVRFSGPKDKDVTGDYFTRETDFDIIQAKETAVYYNHGLDKKMGKTKIGTGILSIDEMGVWIEAQIKEHDEYMADLAKRGKLGWSSGTASHLVERAADGKIKRWPLGLDASLTPTPAEPRNIVSLKSLITSLPEEVEEVVEAEESAQPEIKSETAEINSTQKLEVKMEHEEELQQASAPVEETSADIKTEPVIKPVKEGGYAFKQAPAVKKSTGLGFSDDEDAAFCHWMKTGKINESLKTAMVEGDGPSGGYTVPDGFYNRIIEKRDELSYMRRAGALIIPTSLSVVNVPNEGTAATKFVVTGENSAVDEEEPVLGQVAVTVHKMTKLIKFSEELEADEKANLQGYFSSVFSRTLALAENYYFTSGSGTGEPQGVLTGATSSAVTTASATAITAAELMEMKYTLPDQYTDGASWLMKWATLGKLRGLTGNPFSFMPTPQGGMNNLIDSPVYCTGSMPASTATLKSVLYGNFGFYCIVERAGMTVRRLGELYAASGMIGLLATVRMGGAVLQAEAFRYLTMHA